MNCSVVVPIHNESPTLDPFVRRFCVASAQEQIPVAELLLVENGSLDDTIDVARKLAAELPGVRVLAAPVASYGGALKLGIEAASAEAVVVLECDLLDARFAREALSRLRADADFVVGSKRHPDAIDRRPLQRRLLTWLFNRYLSLRLGFRGTDSHGLKAIRSDVAKRLAGLCITDGEAFQTELVMLADRLGYRIQEIPVHIRESRATPIPIRRRLPKVVRLVGELDRSLKRFPLPPRRRS